MVISDGPSVVTGYGSVEMQRNDRTGVRFGQNSINSNGLDMIKDTHLAHHEEKYYHDECQNQISLCINQINQNSLEKFCVNKQIFFLFFFYEALIISSCHCPCIANIMTENVFKVYQETNNNKT